MTDINCPKGVNPDAYKAWKEEDHNEKVKAFDELCRAIFKLEQLCGVESESDHPLEKAYELIYEFGESEELA